MKDNPLLILNQPRMKIEDLQENVLYRDIVLYSSNEDTRCQNCRS